jgi:hypothetical protein
MQFATKYSGSNEGASVAVECGKRNGSQCKISKTIRYVEHGIATLPIEMPYRRRDICLSSVHISSYKNHAMKRKFDYSTTGVGDDANNNSNTRFHLGLFSCKQNVNKINITLSKSKRRLHEKGAD